MRVYIKVDIENAEQVKARPDYSDFVLFSSTPPLAVWFNRHRLTC
jgi:hypothetical protein